MKTPKITPAPWRPWEGGNSHMVIADNEKTIANLSCMASGQPAADCVHDMAEREANARLIAAAPELYSEVHLLAQVCRSMGPADLGDWNWPDMADRLDALLAKARGEAI